MKKKHFFLSSLIIGITSLTLMSSKSIDNDKNGKVILIRSTGFQGAASKFEAFVDGQIKCKLADGQYSIHEMIAGKHIFTAQYSGKKDKNFQPIEVNVEDGKTYYVEMIYQPAPMRHFIFFQEVTENSAKPLLAKCVEIQNCL